MSQTPNLTEKFLAKNFKNCKVVKIKIPKQFFKNKKIIKLGPVNEFKKNKIIRNLNLNSLSEVTKNFVKDKNTKTEIFNSSKTFYQVFFSNTTIGSNQQHENENEKTILIANFKKIKELKLFCKNIKQSFHFDFYSSKLHKFNKNSLILTIHAKKTQETELVAMLAEFNASTEKGKFQEAIIIEHCHPIFLFNAVEKLAIA